MIAAVLHTIYIQLAGEILVDYDQVYSICRRYIAQLKELYRYRYILWINSGVNRLCAYGGTRHLSSARPVSFPNCFSSLHSIDIANEYIYIYIYVTGSEERQGFFIPATKHPSLELMTFRESKSQTASVWISISSLFLYMYILLLSSKAFFPIRWEFFYSIFFFSLFCHPGRFSFHRDSYIFRLIQSLTSLLPLHFFVSTLLACLSLSASVCVCVCVYILMGNSIRDGLQRAESSLSDLGYRRETSWALALYRSTPMRELLRWAEENRATETTIHTQRKRATHLQ